MRPVLFKIGSIDFPSYTIFILVGILAATYVGFRLARHYGLPVIYVLDMAIIGIVAGFAGGRLAHVLVERPDYYFTLEDPFRVFYFWQGGFVSWGAHAAVLASWVFYLRWRRQALWDYMDIAALSVPAALFFGRIGCLMTGCCFGKPTDFFISLTFAEHGFFPNTPLHATQVYLMLNAFLIGAILCWVAWRRWQFQGQLFFLLLILYAAGRTLIEFLRGDVERGVYFGGRISAAQIVMIGYFFLGLVLYLRFRKRALRNPAQYASRRRK